MPKKLEIEKKFIIAYPDEDYLKSLPECTYSDIEQIYLVCGDDTLSERIRKRGLPGDYKYYHTVKRHITAGTREESEELITEEDGNHIWDKMLKRRRFLPAKSFSEYLSRIK